MVVRRRKIGAEPMKTSRFKAVVFDFDGLILDTETPLFEAWAKTFNHFGVASISLEEWSLSLGRGADDPDVLKPMDRLRSLLERDLDDAEIRVVREAMRDQMLDEAPLRPGVIDRLDEADELGLPVSVASSSPLDWLEHHLGSRGLKDRFQYLSSPGDGIPAKPDPAVYLEACRVMGVSPTDAVAFEDSPNGSRAAKAAGMTCVAVPNGISANLDFSHVDRVVGSLEEVRLSDWA